MQLENSQTIRNLAKAFAGECQAGMRYQFIAKQATSEELFVLADTVKEIAKNETVHAKRFYDEIVKLGGERKISFEADYPYSTGTLEENLFYSAEGEKEEHSVIYRDFALTAKEEGFSEIGSLFTKIAEIEKNHAIIFTYLHNAVKEGTLYRATHPIIWRCSECGYMHTSIEAWKTCPVCNKVQGYAYFPLPFQGVDSIGDEEKQYEKQKLS